MRHHAGFRGCSGWRAIAGHPGSMFDSRTSKTWALRAGEILDVLAGPIVAVGPPAEHLGAVAVLLFG